MPNNETLGASFSIDVTQLKTGLAQANRLIRESESEFKAAAAGMDDWRDSQEGLEARIKHLNTACDLQRQKVDALQDEYDRLVADGLDPTSAAAVKLRTDINKEKEALAKSEKELEKQTKALEDLGEEADDAGDKLGELGDDAEDAGDGFTVAKGAVAGFIANGLTSLVGAAKDAISSVFGLAERTKEFRTEMAKLESAFESAGLGADLAHKSYDDLYSVLGDTGKATEASMLLAQIAKDEEDLDKWNRILVGTFAQYGDSIPTEGLAEAISATSAMGSVQGVLADALEWQGINLDDVNAKLESLSTEEERAAYIQDTLTGLYGESADAYRENNAELIAANEAANDLEKSQAELGKTIEPITTKFTELKAKALTWLLDTGLPALQNGFTWIKDNIPTIAALVGTLTAAWLTFGGAQQLVDSWNKIVAISQAALNTVMNANPIGIIITAVMALVAAFAYLWNNCEDFRNFWVGLWDGIKVAAKAVADWFVQAWTDVSNFFVNLWEGIKSVLSTVGSWIYDNVIAPVANFFVDLWQGLKDAVDAVFGWIKENWQALLLFLVNPVAGVFKYLYDNFDGFRNFVDNVVASVKIFFSDLWSGFVNGAINAWEGVKNTFATVASFFGDIFGRAWQKVKDVFSAGGNIFDGIKDGIVTAFKVVVNAIIRGINKVVSLPFDGLNRILNTISGLDILGIRPFSWLTWRAPVPQIPELATGGVVRKATTAVIGEDGAEAVVPLEKNTGWIKKLAAEIAAQQPQGVVVNQTNNYSQAHSRVELYKTKQATAAAVRLAMTGA